MSRVGIFFLGGQTEAPQVARSAQAGEIRFCLKPVRYPSQEAAGADPRRATRHVSAGKDQNLRLRRRISNVKDLLIRHDSGRRREK